MGSFSEMSSLPSIGALLGLVCVCGVTTQGFAADEIAQLRVPNFSSADFPWFPVRGEFLPPPTGPGPITYDKAHPRTVRTANTWYGESVGHYEGDELVVDTVGFNDKTLLDDSYSVPHTTQLHVIEHFKLMEDGKMLEVTFTVDDPGAFNGPWSGIVRYRRAARAQPLTEQACAENNINVLGDRNVTPTAAKPDF
jgi:hypothetical protein